MANSSFKMNPNFERDLNKVLQDTVKDIAKEYQKSLDSMASRYKGRPIPVIKSALKREWSKLGGSISDRELTSYATHIANGTRIEMIVGK